MVSVLTSNVVERGQIKDNKIGICCFSATHAAERAKTGWLGIRLMCQI